MVVRTVRRGSEHAFQTSFSSTLLLVRQALADSLFSVKESSLEKEDELMETDFCSQTDPDAEHVFDIDSLAVRIDAEAVFLDREACTQLPPPQPEMPFSCYMAEFPSPTADREESWVPL
eukprot:TRINITY_DN32371_c0_g1_i1.p1 TRINITY_DN32371_c0_g1~~TRINITY_DN32371_c0_g1_i1.p1  ORF type:complete len:119 (+),score=25.88 TRINITY_DN32371_c0_g1_i1:59-415(+)